MVIENKRGWIRILEATISILIVTGVLIIVSSNQRIQESSFDSEIIELQGQILSEISTSEELRNWVLGEENSTGRILLQRHVAERISNNLGHSLEVCDLGEPCNLNSTLFTQTRDLEFFIDEAIIVSNITDYIPRKIKLFIWVKEP